MAHIAYTLTRDAYTAIPKDKIQTGYYLSLPPQPGRVGRRDRLEYLTSNAVPTVPADGGPHRLSQVLDYDHQRSSGPVRLLSAFGNDPVYVLYVRWLGDYVWDNETGDESDLYCLTIYNGID